MPAPCHVPGEGNLCPARAGPFPPARGSELPGPFLSILTLGSAPSHLGPLLVSPEDSTRARVRPLVLCSTSRRSRKVQLSATWGTSRTIMSSTRTRYCLGAEGSTQFVVSKSRGAH